LQSVAVCCSVLQSVAVCCSVKLTAHQSRDSQQPARFCVDTYVSVLFVCCVVCNWIFCVFLYVQYIFLCVDRSFVRLICVLMDLFCVVCCV